MKFKNLRLLAIVTALFAALTLGFFWGSSFNREPLTLPPDTSPPLSTGNEETQGYDFLNPPGFGSNGSRKTTVNINTAGLEELMTLPGIGPSIAQSIIDYRLEHGPFSTVTELGMVDGIGSSKLEALLDLITVGG